MGAPSFSFPQEDRPPAITADMHMHTLHSHGQNSTEEMFKAALAKKLSIIGFSEHSPRPEGYTYPTDYQVKLREHLPAYVHEVRELAQVGREHHVDVLLGLEVDFIPCQQAYAETLTKAYAFDYIIGGLHFLGSWGFDFSPLDWDGMSMDECFSAYARYYRDLAAMCQSRLFHIAAHPDLIKIFSIDRFNLWLGDNAAMPLIKNALTAMKDNGVVLEVSSAGLRKPCREIYPGPRIMEQAAKLELPISFASDAHCVATPAFAFDDLARYAAGFGYTRSCIVADGKLRSIPFTAPPLL